jgi:hypothetical protein
LGTAGARENGGRRRHRRTGDDGSSNTSSGRHSGQPLARCGGRGREGAAVSEGETREGGQAATTQRTDDGGGIDGEQMGRRRMHCRTEGDT